MPVKLSFSCWILCLVICASGEEPSRSPLLFHCSFDGRPAGSAEPYTTAVYSAGDPRPRGEVNGEADPEGRFGQAVHLAGDGVLAYDAFDNLHAERGAIAFWIKPTDNFGPHHDSYLVTVYSLPMMFEIGRPFIRGKLDSRIKVQGWGMDEFIGRDWGDWSVGTWKHVVIGWDAVKGWSLTIDGALVAESRDSFWPDRLLDRIGIGAMVNSFRFIHHGIMSKSFDEFYVFDRMLEPDEIRTLMAKNEPPTDSPRPRLDEDWLAWRVHEMGLDGPLPSLACGEAVHRVTYSFARKAKVVKRTSYLPMDGRSGTFWPLRYQGYSIGNDDVTIHLDPGSNAAGWLRARGDLSGTIAPGEPWEVDLNDSGLPTWGSSSRWKKFPTPVNANEIRVTRRSGNLDELDFVRLESGPSPAGESDWLYPGKRNEPAPEIAQRYEAWDRSLSRLTAEPGPEDAFHLPAGRLLHLQAGPFGGDKGIGATRWRFAFEDIADGTRMRVVLMDPVYQLRELCSFEFAIAVEEEGKQTLDVLLDHRDLQLRAGRRLWWMACFDHDVTFRRGAGGTRAALLPPAPDSDQFVWDQVYAMRALYNFISQDDPSQRKGNPWHTFRSLDELMTLAEEVLHVEPGNAFARAVWHRIGLHKHLWTEEARARHVDLEGEDCVIPTGGAPRWAAVGCAALKAMRVHSDWWIDHRQAANGEFGSDANDDTDLLTDFPNFALIGDKDSKIKHASALLNDYVWEHRLEDGINILGTDLNHAFEEGISVLRINAMLHYGDPVLFERLFGPARFIRDTYTGVTPDGHRHIRSYNFSASSLGTTGGWGVDVGSANMFEPAIYVHWYNGNPTAFNLLREWAESWLDHDEGDGRFGRRPIAFATHAPPRVRKVGFRGGNLSEVYCLLFEQTGDPKYNRILFDAVPDGRSPREYKVFQRFNDCIPSYRRLLEERGVDTSAIDPVILEKSDYGTLRWRINKDRNELISDLEDAYLFMRRMAPMVTWAGLAADRVAVKGQIPLAHMFLGGSASRMKWQTYWYHAVSWEGADDDIARFVIDQGDQRLKVLLYSFHDEPREIGMRVWRLAEGTYRIGYGKDADRDDMIDAVLEERETALSRWSRIPLTVPPRIQMVLELDQVAKGGDIRNRPDLALSHRDLVYHRAESALIVVVHNIGAVATPASEIVLSRAGKVLARKEVPALPAPTDFLPKKTEVRFDGIDDPAGIAVQVDPADRVDEITESNNRLRSFMGP